VGTSATVRVSYAVMTRAVVIGGLACALTAAAAGRARADFLEQNGVGDGQAVETRHDVDVVVADRVARFRVTRRIANRGHGVIRARLHVELPSRAVARGLRLRSAGRWIAGRLMAADAAAEAWDKLTTTGNQMVHGPALLEWESGGGLSLSVYPIPTGGHVDVAYTLEAPVCYTHGRWITEYPIAADDMAKIALRVRGPRGPGRVLGGKQLAAELGAAVADACGNDVGLGEASSVRYLVVDAPVAPPARVHYARAIAGDADAARLTIDVADVIQPAPRGARVAFVVDASRTMGEAGIAAELAWIRGYLAHVPDAEFEVVLYRRRPDRLLGRFAPASRAAALLDAIDPARLVPGNGSNLDEGLRAATAMLAGTRRPVRVVAFTDERWRPALGAPAVVASLAELGPDAVLHVVGLGPGSTGAPSLTRDDDDALAPVAARWGGMMIEAQGGAGQPAAAFAAAALELVRPLRIDQVHIVGAANEDGHDLGDLGDLGEGVGVYHAWLVDEAPRAVEGKIWGRTWRQPLASTPAAARRWAGLIIADPLADNLTTEQALALATMGAVVSPQTSFLALDPRFGAARLPDEWMEASSCDCFGPQSYLGVGHAGTVGHSSCTGVGELDLHAAILAALLAPRAQACAVQTRQRAWHLKVAFDTTGDEIVDVHARAGVTADPTAGGPSGVDAMRACVEEAAWDLQLDGRFAAWTGHYVASVDGAR